MLLDKERVKGREVKRNEVDKVKTTDGAERVNSLRSVSFRNNYFEREVNSFLCKVSVRI
jgi:predicted Zn-dependent peptidase